jgi:hypothetical protein
MFCSVFLAAILICEAIHGSESFRCSFKAFGTPASASRGQHMLHTAIEMFTGSSLVDLLHACGRLQGATAMSTQMTLRSNLWQ